MSAKIQYVGAIFILGCPIQQAIIFWNIQGGINMCRVELFMEKHKRACTFIRNSRVTKKRKIYSKTEEVQSTFMICVKIGKKKNVPFGS